MSATTLIKDRFYSLYAKLLNIYYVRNSLKTSNYVDLNSLKGTWNEIVRNPNPLQLSTNQYQITFFTKDSKLVTGNSKLLMMEKYILMIILDLVYLLQCIIQIY
jgi:lipocalin